MAGDVNFASKTDFDPAVRGWHAGNVRTMTYCSGLAYSDPDAVQATLDSWKLKFTGKLDAGNTQGFLGQTAKAAVVCFRGTEPNAAFDWATDAMAQQIDGPFGRVHLGFSRALDLVWPQVKDFIDQSVKGGLRVFIAGHSLGGALALLAVARALEEQVALPKQLSLHTVGQPRVGNSDFTKAVDQAMGKNMVRIVNNIDLVPRVPPRQSFIGHYDHCRGVVWIDVDGVLHSDPKYWETLLKILEFTPLPDVSTATSPPVIDGLPGLLEKYVPHNRSLTSLLDLGVSFFTSKVTRLVARSIGQDTLKHPLSMITDHFIDNYKRLLDAKDDPSD